MSGDDQGHSVWLCALGLLLVGACTVTTGARGTLGFGYDAFDGLAATRLESALVAGEEVDVVVYASGNPGEPSSFVTVMGKRELAANRVQRASVVRATSSDPRVLSVVRIDGSTIRLRGNAAGTAALVVDSAAGRDRVSIRVAEVGHVEIDHWAWRDRQRTGPGQTVLLRGGLAHFTLARKTDTGRPLTGYGASRAVAIEPAGAAAVENHPEDTSHFRVRPNSIGRLALTPSRGTGLALQIVNPDAVTQLELAPIDLSSGHAQADPPVGVHVGSVAVYLLAAHIADGRRALGLDGTAELKVQDVTICQVDRLTRWLGDGVIAVRGLAPGPCRLTARLGAATTEQTVDITSITVPPASGKPQSSASSAGTL